MRLVSPFKKGVRIPEKHQKKKRQIKESPINPYNKPKLKILFKYTSLLLLLPLLMLMLFVLELVHVLVPVPVLVLVLVLLLLLVVLVSVLVLVAAACSSCGVVASSGCAAASDWFCSLN